MCNVDHVQLCQANMSLVEDCWHLCRLKASVLTKGMSSHICIPMTYPECDADPIAIMMMHNIGFERQHCHMIMVSCCSLTGRIGIFVEQQLDCIEHCIVVILKVDVSRHDYKLY